MFYRKIIYGAVLLISAFLLVWPGYIRAEQTGIQISPLTYNFEVNPGEEKELSILVTNLNDQALNYLIEVENFNYVSEAGAPYFEGLTEDSSVTTLKDWITLVDSSQREGAIEAKGSKEIKFTIAVPEGAEPGGHYAAIFAKEIKKTEENKTQIGVASRVGTLILVSVPGDVSRKAEIVEFSPPKIIWSGPLELSMKVKNIGSVHYDSQGAIEIKSMLGKVSEIDMGMHKLIPKNTRAYSATWGNKYPIGRYSLTAKAYDGDGNLVTKNSVLWAIPLIIVVPVLVGLLVLILVSIYLARHIKFVK